MPLMQPRRLQTFRAGDYAPLLRAAALSITMLTRLMRVLAHFPLPHTSAAYLHAYYFHAIIATLSLLLQPGGCSV